MKVSLNIDFSNVNQCNCYQISYRNPDFVTISRDMRYTVIMIQFSVPTLRHKLRSSHVNFFFLRHYEGQLKAVVSQEEADEKIDWKR